MLPRDNLLSLLKRQGFSQIPVDFNLCPSLEEQYHEREQTAEDYRSYFQMPWRDVQGLIPMRSDPERFFPYFPEEVRRDPAVSIDGDGVGHRKTPTSMHMTQMLHPLGDADSLEQIQTYPLADFDLAENLPAIRAEVERIHGMGLAAVGNMQCTIWESAWYIRGMENLMMDMLSDEEMAACILDKVTERSLHSALIYAHAGADILFLGDDVGMQQSIMMSESLYEEWLKPRLSKIISAAKAVNPNLLVFYHSCGYIEPFIPTWIDIGIDVLNPVQPECMDFARLHEAYGDRLSFHGTIGTQSVMPFGTPQEVRKTVEQNLRIAGDQGGLFAAPTHLLEPEVPWENVLAYVDACKRFCG